MPPFPLPGTCCSPRPWLRPSSAPAGTSTDIIHALNAETNKALAKPTIKERIAQFFAEPAPSSPEELGEFVRQQLAAWGTRIKQAGIEPE